MHSPPWLREYSAWPLFEDPTKTISQSTAIHGIVRLPDGYGLAYIPKDAVLQPIKATARSKGAYKDDITCSYSFSKALFAVVQALYASVTLYESRGDQIDRYGYAAFGLTVVPYVVMSIINLISAAVNPEYASLYLVASDTMDEAISRGGEFHGIIGRLESEEIDADPARTVLFSASYEKDSENSPEYLKCHVPSHPEDSKSDGPEEVQIQITDGISEVVRPNMMRHRQKGQGFAFESVVDFHTSFISIPSCHNFKRTTPGANSLSFDDPAFFDLLYPKKSVTIIVPKLFTFMLTINNPAFELFRLAPTVCGVVVGAISIAIIGGISHFDKGGSSLAQRVWTMTWLAVGIVFGAVASEATPFNAKTALSMLLMMLQNLLFAAPAIGGFVVVSQMLRGYGSCESLS